MRILAVRTVVLVLAFTFMAGLLHVYDINEILWFAGRLPIVRHFVWHPSVDDQIAKYGPAARGRLAKIFDGQHISYPPDRVAFVAIKATRELQIYCASADGSFHFLYTYPILGASGHLGPKLRSGDRQVPEGIYQLSLEPNTPYHVALRLNYPNEFDLQHAKEEGRNPGGDILVHGTTGSVGCIAVGDQASEDLFVLAHDTKNSEIRLIIAPVDFRTGVQAPKAAADPGWLPTLYAAISHALNEFPGSMISGPAEDDSQSEDFYEWRMAQSQKEFRSGSVVIKSRPNYAGIKELDIYHNNKVILHKAIEYDFMSLGFPYRGRPVRSTRSYDGYDRDFISSAMKPSATPFVDFDGNGIPDIVIDCSAGNRGEDYYLYSLGRRARLLATLSTIRSGADFMDVDGDGKCEVLTVDPTFFGWQTCNAESAMPFVVLKYQTGKLRLATSLMKTPPPSPAIQKQLLEKWSQECRDDVEDRKIEADYHGNTFYLSPKVWSSLLDLIYSGNADIAFDLLDKFWRTGIHAGNLEYGDCKALLTGKNRFKQMFLEQLSQSPYLVEIKQLNKGNREIARLRALSSAVRNRVNMAIIARGANIYI